MIKISDAKVEKFMRVHSTLVEGGGLGEKFSKCGKTKAGAEKTGGGWLGE